MVQQDSNTENEAAFVVSLPRTTQCPMCKHCGEMRHEEHNCFEIIGYTIGWDPRRGGRGRGARGGRGNAGWGRGHAGVYVVHAATEPGRAAVESHASTQIEKVVIHLWYSD